MESLKPLETAPDLAERVYRQVLDAICAGELAPGTRITQEELADSLGVSRQPVHQALRLLKKEGFVVEAGKRGVMVSALDTGTLVRLYQVRGVLDGLAARLAAQAGSRLDPSLIDVGRKASARGARSMIEADVRFHQALYAASGNPLIEETARRHWQHIARAMGAVLEPVGMAQTVWQEHQGILDAINRGDANEAERLARAHCEEAARHLSQSAQRLFPEEERHEA